MHDFLFDFSRNCAFILYHFWFIVSYLSKVPYFNLPHLHHSPLLGVTAFEFRREIWCQETIIRVQSCDVVCVILGFAVLTQYGCVTHTQTHLDSIHNALAWRRAVKTCCDVIAWSESKAWYEWYFEVLTQSASSDTTRRKLYCWLRCGALALYMKVIVKTSACVVGDIMRDR